MSGWGISETAPVIEKIKAESADYLKGLNSCGEITWSVYDKAFDFYMELISRAYEQGKNDAQPKSTEQIKWERNTAVEQLKELGYGLGEKIIHCKDCKWFCEMIHQCDRQIAAVMFENDFCSYAEWRTDDEQ